MDPMAMVIGPMAADPNHFVIAVPIPSAVVLMIEWPVADLDLNPDRWNGGRHKDARGKNGEKQKFVSNHNSIDHAGSGMANTFGGGS